MHFAHGTINYALLRLLIGQSCIPRRINPGCVNIASETSFYLLQSSKKNYASSSRYQLKKENKIIEFLSEYFKFNLAYRILLPRFMILRMFENYFFISTCVPSAILRSVLTL